MKQLIIQLQATQEADKVAKWYEDQFPGLGVEFLLELDTALGRVINNPDIYQPVYEDARRVLVRSSLCFLLTVMCSIGCRESNN